MIDCILVLGYVISLCLIFCFAYAYGTYNNINEIKNIIFYTCFVVLTILNTTCFILYADNAQQKSKQKTVEQKCIDNHISYELVQSIDEYSDKNEEEIYSFIVMVADDEMDLYDAIHYIDNSLTDNDIDAILNLASLKEKQNGK